MTTITQVITTLPTAPARSQAPATFITNADAHVASLSTLVSEINTWRTQANTMALGLNAIATGAALAIPLTFSTTTTDSDPGNGIVRLNQATQNTATVIRTDLIGNDGSTWTDVIALFDDSTSTVKGFIVLVDVTDATKWLVFSVASLATPSGYVNITVACVASSSANPFANGASLALQFTRTGDKGDTGATGAAGGLTGGSLTGSLNFARATVASHATTADIWAAAGNQIDWTGTETTTIFPNAPQGGATRTLICAGACSFTAGANMLIDGVTSGNSVTCAANDKMIVEAVSTTQFKLSRVKYDGTAQVAGAAGLSAASQAQAEAGTADTVAITPLSANWHPGAAKAWIKCDAAGAIQASHNITSVTDTGTGIVTVTIATDFSSADYAITMTVYLSGGSDRVPKLGTAGAPTAGAFVMTYANDTLGAQDPTNYFAACFGDQ